ncbi:MULTISPECIES: hypothetical protein [Micromonospora]|uniref:hypothetical protein n=1 Tax=Micromonospora TaxID=1873 RepID=UPI00130526DF|nr:hypothetical protein [Micromonospora sp. S4605]
MRIRTSGAAAYGAAHRSTRSPSRVPSRAVGLTRRRRLLAVLVIVAGVVMLAPVTRIG